MIDACYYIDKKRRGEGKMKKIIVTMMMIAGMMILTGCGQDLDPLNNTESNNEEPKVVTASEVGQVKESEPVYTIEGLDYNQMYENCGVVCASNVMDLVTESDTTEEEVMSYAVTHGLATKAGGTTAMDIQNIMYEMAGVESSWVNNPTLDELEVAAEEGVAIIAVHAETVYYGGKGELDHWITVIDKVDGGWVVADSNGVAYYDDETMRMATDGEGQEMIVIR